MNVNEIIEIRVFLLLQKFPSFFKLFNILLYKVIWNFSKNSFITVLSYNFLYNSYLKDRIFLKNFHSFNLWLNGGWTHALSTFFIKDTFPNFWKHLKHKIWNISHLSNINLNFARNLILHSYVCLFTSTFVSTIVIIDSSPRLVLSLADQVELKDRRRRKEEIRRRGGGGGWGRKKGWLFLASRKIINIQTGISGRRVYTFRLHGKEAISSTEE